MATVKEMKATARPLGGKGTARAERRAGRVPGVIYGDNKAPITISVDHAELKQRIYAGHFLTSIYEIDVEGTKHRVIPRDFQLDSVRDLPIHVDFLRLSAGAAIRVRIPVRVINADVAPGIKRGGAVNIVTHSVEVLCAPEDIPDAINVDLTGLEINYSKHLNEVELPKGVRVVGRPDQTLVTIVPPSGYAEETKGPADGAAPAATASAAAPASPAAGAAKAGDKKAPGGDKKAAGGDKKGGDKKK